MCGCYCAHLLCRITKSSQRDTKRRGQRKTQNMSENRILSLKFLLLTITLPRIIVPFFTFSLINIINYMKILIVISIKY